MPHRRTDGSRERYLRTERASTEPAVHHTRIVHCCNARHCYNVGEDWAQDCKQACRCLRRLHSPNLGLVRGEIQSKSRARGMTRAVRRKKRVPKPKFAEHLANRQRNPEGPHISSAEIHLFICLSCFPHLQNTFTNDPLFLYPPHSNQDACYRAPHYQGYAPSLTTTHHPSC
jgi:hypothetical protein